MGRDCKYCGAYISDSVGVCPACGKKVKAEKPSETDEFSYKSYSGSAAQAQQYAPEDKDPENSAEPQGYKANRGNSYSYSYTYNNQNAASSNGYKQDHRYDAPPAGMNARAQSGERTNAEDEDVRRNKGIAFLCYFGPLFLVPYLMRRDSEFVRFHANQGLLLLLADVALTFCQAIPVIGWLMRIIGSLFILTCFISGLQHVSKGMKKPLPVIGEINILK